MAWLQLFQVCWEVRFLDAGSAIDGACYCQLRQRIAAQAVTVGSRAYCLTTPSIAGGTFAPAQR